MAFLTLAGITIDVSTDGASQLEGDVVGEKARMFDGTLRSTVRATKRAWRITSPVLTQVQESAIRTAIANHATVTLSGDIVGGANVSVKVTPTESAFVPDGLSFRRALSLLIEEA